MDIEDINKETKKSPKRDIVTEIHRKREEEVVNPPINLPKSQSVYVKSFGCPHNSSDGEYMAGLLHAEGYKIVDKLEDSDIAILNSCTVKNPSQEAFATLLKKAQELNKIAIAAGCVPQAEPTLSFLDDCSVVGVQQISRIVEVVEEAQKGHIVKLLDRDTIPRLNLPKIRKNKYVEIVPLSTGCLGQCTFCKTKQARGGLMSYAPPAIIERVKQVIEEGVIELWLTSEDAGIYGRDIGHSLPELLWEVLAVIKPHNIIKVGMTNPPYIMEHMEEIGSILNHPQVYSHMHIPVQTGSNPVLEAMVREYTIDDFQKLADYLIGNVPNITIATDIICGFPTETEEDHQLTLDLIKKYKFASLFISQFYPRPGTVAADMKKLDTKIVKKRSTEVTKLFETYKTFDSLVGTEQKVWVTELETNKKNMKEHGGQGEKSEVAIVGHTKNYVKVIIRDLDHSLLGKCVLVKIIEAQKWHVVGVVTNKTYIPEPPLPVSHFKREYQKTKVNYLAKERMGKLNDVIDKNRSQTKSQNLLITRKDGGFPWMKVALMLGAILVLIGIIMTLFGK